MTCPGYNLAPQLELINSNTVQSSSFKIQFTHAGSTPSTSMMQILMAAAVAFLFPLHACANAGYWNSSMKWVKDKWTVESVSFTRLGNISDPKQSFNTGFELYYHEWTACNASAPAAGSSFSPDPGLRGLDLETSKIGVRCSLYNDGPFGEQFPIPYPETFWRLCQGRWKEKKNCKGKAYAEVLNETGDCVYGHSMEEDMSGQPWIRWRAAAIDETPMSIADRITDPSKAFRSIRFELVNGQRLVA
jgi:hypothetical protein